MNTPTPRTDSQAGWAIANQYGQSTGSELLGSPDGVFVHAVFARTLERELASIRSLANRRNKQDHSQDTTHQLVASLDQALDIAQAELATEREKVRTLSLACERIVEQWDKNHIAAPFHASSVMYSWASTALATTEEIK